MSLSSLASHAFPVRIVLLWLGPLALVLTLLGASLTSVPLVVRAPGTLQPRATVAPIVIPESLANVRVLQILRGEGQTVQKGELLFLFDLTALKAEVETQEQRIRQGKEQLATRLSRRADAEADFQIALKNAENDLRQAEQDVKQREEQRQREIRLRKTQLESAQQDAERSEKLAAVGAESREKLEKARQKLAQARQALALAETPVNRSELETTRNELAQRRQDHERRSARLEQQLRDDEASLTNLRTRLLPMELRLQSALQAQRAPLAGVVVQCRVQPGAVPETGRPVILLAEQAEHCFEMSLPTRNLPPLKGYPVQIRLEGLDPAIHGVLTGTIKEVIAPSTEGSDPATARVRVELDRQELGGEHQKVELRFGMTGQAEVVLGRRSALAHGLHRLRHLVGLE